MTEELSAAELAVRLEQGSVVVVDLRPAEQVARGYIPGSWPVAIAELPGRLRVAGGVRAWSRAGQPLNHD